jgi:hypothetical protein
MRYVVKNFQPSPGSHCISNAIKQIFRFYGYSLSEEMIFGLASGLNFFYFEFKNIPYPLIGGRTKIGDFEENLACNLGISINIHTTSSTIKAYDEMKRLIEKNIPIIIYVDMNALSYLGMPQDVHFGGHTVVVFGIDEEEGIAYVSDRDSEKKSITLNPKEKPSDYHKVALNDLSRARGSTYKPYPPKNKWLTFDLSGMWGIDQNVIFEAIRETCTVMRCPPIKNLGLNGIRHFAQKVKEWENYSEENFKRAAFNAFIMIDEKGGTGGGAFRRMYGNYLRECVALTGLEELDSIGKEYITLSEWWDDVADKLLKMSTSGNVNKLDDIADLLTLIHHKEENLIQHLCVLVSGYTEGND